MDEKPTELNEKEAKEAKDAPTTHGLDEGEDSLPGSALFDAVAEAVEIELVHTLSLKLQEAPLTFVNRTNIQISLPLSRLEGAEETADND